MALRIRRDGRILCAAIHPAELGDTYIHDGMHYRLSVEEKLICTEPIDEHMKRGEWWWIGNIPDGVVIDDFYLNPIEDTEVYSV